MTAHPVTRAHPAEGPWSLRRVERPDPEWYRGLFRRIGADWLWTSRLRLPDEDLARVIRRTGVEVYTLRLA